MKRSSSLFVPILAFLLVAALAPPAASGSYDNAYPFPFLNTRTLDQYEQFQMQQGLFENGLAWFITTDVNNVKLAFDTYFDYTLYWMGVTYAPKLTHALQGIPEMYVVTNFSQGPVFSAAPADPDTGDNYAGVWKVVYITYKSEAFKRPVTNAHETSGLNPTGLPPSTEADYNPAEWDEATVVMNCPIVALGPLGGPWYPTAADRYRIPQGRVIPDYGYTKIIWLPYWYVYCTDPVTHYVSVRRVIVPDVYEPDTIPEAEQLIPRIGANSAPGLATIPSAAQRLFYFMNDPKPWSQYPVMSSFPNHPYEPWRNAYTDYSPLATYITLDRNIPFYSVVKPPSYLESLLITPAPFPAPPGTMLLEVDRDTQRLNAPILPEWAQTP